MSPGASRCSGFVFTRFYSANTTMVDPLRNRITWTPNSDGTVRQLWEVSKDQGESWQTEFDGLYKRQSRAP